ncbi:hypothetical protein GCM10007420_21310 [Glycocaulis albus]|uniref:Uncharacterized protein n=1 Tax=Glycocaulis albus TaxID=1382801 RepID=A0ABQ1XWF7_9PROT|nr:hypothetical protein [Glycocaulis albus]GGH04565.1 hypothetical protein GCM10007420_21310 [Glycocaulis albus]
MNDAPVIALVCSDGDRARVWGLAAWLMRQGSSVVVGWNAGTDPVPGWLVVCYSDATVEDLAVSRAVTGFLRFAPRERLLRVELGGASEGVLPPVLVCDRGPDGLLVSLPPPFLAGSICPDREPADIDAVGKKLLDMAGRSAPQTRRGLYLRSSFIALTAAVAICLTLGIFNVQLGHELERARAAEAEAIRFADSQLIEIATPLQAGARQSVMITAGEAILDRGMPHAPNDADRVRRIRLLTWLAEARDLAGDPSGAMQAYSTAMEMGNEWPAGPPDTDSLLALAELTSSAGVSAYRAGDIERARSSLDASREYADALLALAPDSRDARQRAASAHLNSAVMSLESDEPDLALASLQAAISGYEALQREYGEYAGELANALGWAADAYRANGQLAEAADTRGREADIFTGQLRDDPDNNLTAVRLANAAHAEAALRVDVGETARAAEALERAAAILEGLVALDPENARYLRLLLSVQRDRAELALFESALIRAQLLIDRARRLRVSRDPQGSNDGRVLENASFDILSGQVALAAAAYDEAAVSAANALAGLTPELESGRANARLLALRAQLLRYDAFIALGRPEAPRVAREALALTGDIETVRDLRTRDLVSRVYWLAGERDQALTIRAELEEAGYARPDYVSFWARPEAPETASTLNRERTGNDG